MFTNRSQPQPPPPALQLLPLLQPVPPPSPSSSSSSPSLGGTLTDKLDSISSENITNISLDGAYSGHCGTWFDGIYQWPMTPPNVTISIECNEIFAFTMGDVGSDHYQQQRHVYAQRRCLANGVWGWNNWTNYTQCLNLLALQEKESKSINQLQDIVSYVVLILLIASFVSLMLSIVIFISFKPLQCLRIRVHKNLCIALLLNCSLYIVMNSLAGIHRLDLSVVADWFCKSLKCLNVYTSMATINWMFVEGFIFHRRLYAPFHSNTFGYIFAYYAVGWILPGACVLAWSLSLEFFSVVAHKPCWEGYRTSNTIFIVSTPMIAAVAVNFVFLVSIIRILLTKLRADTSKSDQATIKAIKATALLIPLLGIHHLVVLYNPSTFNRKLVNVYIVLNVLFQSVQGIIVSVLYCFTNNEVRAVLNSAWSRRRMSHMSGALHSVAVPHQYGESGQMLGASKRRRPSAGSNSFNSLIVTNQPNYTSNTNINNNNNNNNEFGVENSDNEDTINSVRGKSAHHNNDNNNHHSRNNNNNNHHLTLKTCVTKDGYLAPPNAAIVVHTLPLLAPQLPNIDDDNNDHSENDADDDDDDENNNNNNNDNNNNKFNKEGKHHERYQRSQQSPLNSNQHQPMLMAPASRQISQPKMASSPPLEPTPTIGGSPKQAGQQTSITDL